MSISSNLIKNISKSSFSTLAAVPKEGRIDLKLNDNGLAILTLNRPHALNALSLDMVQQINHNLLNFKRDSKVNTILFNAVGGKSFCAGGDIVALSTDPKAGAIFFRTEYFMNHLIASYLKVAKIPIISLIHGIVMGGGVGISLNGPIRVASETTTFAMPETTIGFFPDVGGSFLLPRLANRKHGLGLYLGLTGKRLKGLDLIISGVATHFIHSKKHQDFMQDISGHKIDTKEDLTALLERYHAIESSAEHFLTKEILESMEKAFGDHVTSVESIFEILSKMSSEGNKFATDTLKDLNSKCPLSLKISFRALRENSNKKLHEALKTEFRLSIRLSSSHDFKEGVRALLIDKDNKPDWQYKDLSSISTDVVNSFFEPLDNTIKEFDATELPLLMNPANAKL